MNPKIIEIIDHSFSQKERTLVLEELSSIDLDHVMANSEYNLTQTRMAILKLAKGKLKDVQAYVKAAKIDFRDVIMWSIQDES